MKTIKVSDRSHARLTAILGQIIALSGEMRNYSDAVDAVLEEAVLIPIDFAREIQDFIDKNKQLGFSTKDDFVRDVIRQAMIHNRRTLSS